MNRSTALTVLSAVAALGVLITSCEKDKGKDPNNTTGTTTTGGTTGTTTGTTSANTCDTITYTKHIKPLVDANCATAGCHGAPTSNPLFTTYDLVKSKADRIKIRTIDYATNSLTRMPPDPNPELTPAQKALINCWVQNGQKQ
jgi:hypothetical protein